MQTGVLTVGILTLNETNVLEDTLGSTGKYADSRRHARTLRVNGIETTCDLSAVEELEANIMNLADRIMPITFQYKASFNGYYEVYGINVSLEKWFNGATAVTWSLTLGLMGPDNSVTMESRLVQIVRANDFTLSGERWHAPAIGHYGYFIGANTPSPLTRVSANGNVTAYRTIPANINPRWGVPLTNFLSGRAKLLVNSIERIGEMLPLSTTNWEVNNGLVRVRPASASGTLIVSAWTGGAWQDKLWDIRFSGTAIITATNVLSVTTLQTDPEAVIIRILANSPANSTRVLIDLTLRRGSRFVEGYIQQAVSGTIDVTLNSAETFTNNSASGYVFATAADAAGNKAAAGSAKSFTLHANGGITKTATTTLDFWLGVEIASAPAGDQAINLRDQYIAVATESTVVTPL